MKLDVLDYMELLRTAHGCVVAARNVQVPEVEAVEAVELKNSVALLFVRSDHLHFGIELDHKSLVAVVGVERAERLEVAYLGGCVVVIRCVVLVVRLKIWFYVVEAMHVLLVPGLTITAPVDHISVDH